MVKVTDINIGQCIYMIYNKIEHNNILIIICFTMNYSAMLQRHQLHIHFVDTSYYYPSLCVGRVLASLYYCIIHQFQLLLLLLFWRDIPAWAPKPLAGPLSVSVLLGRSMIIYDSYGRFSKILSDVFNNFFCSVESKLKS